MIGALIAVCAVLAFRAEQARDRLARTARPAGWIGWPVVTGLVGTAAYGSVRVLLLALHNSAGLPGYVVTLLLADQAGGVGYLLKDRVFSDDQFVDVIRTVAAGGTVMDPEVVTKLLDRRSRGEREPLSRLTERERRVLELMAEGRSNSAIANRLFISEKAVSKHSTSIFTKLELAPSDDDNRRVLAVLAHLMCVPREGRIPPSH
ncbi:LuxR C-terminal-related transcriptional regulator [Streptomyces mirabilis]|uniref:response regulator transcription factor n=1 Tax=Streptomyces mirabilis TaxID=68239 RepID=UPI00363E988A